MISPTKVVWSLLAALLVAAPAAAVTEEAGYGEAVLGMKLEEVREHYPDMEVLESALGLPLPENDDIDIFVLRHQPLGDLEKKVQVELRFWKKTLFMVIFHFDEADADRIEKEIRSRVELPEDANLPWKGEQYGISLNRHHQWLSMFDTQVWGEVEQALLEDLKEKIRERQIRVAFPTPPAVSEKQLKEEMENKAAEAQAESKPDAAEKPETQGDGK